jgi:C-terminal processing protease CtpA/Prc
MPSDQVSSYIGGVIVVELDEDATGDLKPYDVITHVNGKPVGYLVHESTVWFLPQDKAEVELTLVKQDGTHQLVTHNTMILPSKLDSAPASSRTTHLVRGNLYAFHVIKCI